MARVDQDGLIPGLGRDAPAAELLDGHLEQRPAAAMLRDAERRLDEEAERDRAMRLHGDMHAAPRLRSRRLETSAVALGSTAFPADCLHRPDSHCP